VDWVPGTLAALPGWLAEGRIDAIAAKAVIPDRVAAFAFSDPLVETAAALFGPPGSAPPHPAKAGAARIATPAAGPLAALLPRLAPRALVVAVADYAAALAAVEAGAADWAALNADVTPALFPARTGPAGPRWAPLGLAVAVAPGDPGKVLARLALARDFPAGK
jgi:ABC-type amino acid transport substrate-binding protein